MRIKLHITRLTQGAHPDKLRSQKLDRACFARSPRAATASRYIGIPAIRAFTLMEVMIAIGVFCIGVFAILGLVANVMHGARLLEKPMVDASVVAANIANTNSFIEGTFSGDLSEFLGNAYKGYEYAGDIVEEQSNKLYRADILVTSDAPGKPVISKMSILLYGPRSPQGSLDGGPHQ